MIFLYDGPESLNDINFAVQKGRLFSPLTNRSSTMDEGCVFGVDNGCFKRFLSNRFYGLLERLKPRKEQCLFVACPDVVGDARRTLELFDHHRGTLAGWPVALVAQDGLEQLKIPWDRINAIFIGGSTKWKLSKHAAAIVVAAKILGKHVHVGRVNTWLRFDKFLNLGADSFDGTGLTKYSHMREKFQLRCLPGICDEEHEATSIFDES